jgi:hypothetical protein
MRRRLELAPGSSPLSPVSPSVSLRASALPRRSSFGSGATLLLRFELLLWCRNGLRLRLPAFASLLLRDFLRLPSSPSAPSAKGLCVSWVMLMPVLLVSAGPSRALAMLPCECTRGRSEEKEWCECPESRECTEALSLAGGVWLMRAMEGVVEGGRCGLRRDAAERLAHAPHVSTAPRRAPRERSQYAECPCPAT